MKRPPHTGFPAVLALFATLASAQQTQPDGPPTNTATRTLGLPTLIPGRLVDLATDSSGRVLYATRGGEVGSFHPSSSGVAVLAPAGTFANELRAVVEDRNGDVLLLEEDGDVQRLPGRALPVAAAYSDLYMIHDATDLIVDGRGNFLIASSTPSNGQRCTNRISSDGVRWDYHIVRHQPVQIAADPLTGDILLADEDLGGVLRLIDSQDPTHPTTPLDTTTAFGIDSSTDDGDMAVEDDGDLFLIAGGEVWFHDRTGGSTTLFASGYGQLTGATIAASTGLVQSSTGWSLYLAEEGSPSEIHELPGVGAPGDPIATDQGRVPGRGRQRLFFTGIQVFELAKDNAGDLLVGGHLYGSNPSVRRVDIATMTMTVVADASDGLSGTIEGITVAPDDTIYALTRQGVIHRIRENPLSVTTVYDDLSNQVTAGKDLALDVDGTLYVADRDYWGGGEVVEVANGSGSSLVLASEVRGLSADPLTGGMFVSEWNCPGFCGSVGLYDFGSQAIEDLAGFDGMNYTNDLVWGDGDTVVNVQGSVYTVSEDDWSVVRYDPAKNGYARILSGYLNHPTGVVIAPSSEPTSSGWSLYVSEYDWLWEHPNVPAPAATLVDSQSSMMGIVVGTLNPKLGRPRDLVPDPAGGGFYVATSDATLARVDLASGNVQTVADAASGLSGDLVAVDALSDGRIVLANRAGDLTTLDPGRGFAREVLHDDSLDLLSDVRGLAVDDQDRLLVVDRTGADGLLLGWDGMLVPLAPAVGGLRPAIDPLRGHFFLTAEGADIASGRLQRVKKSNFKTRTIRPRSPWGLPFGANDGGIVFDSAGNVYLTTAGNGRVIRIDRGTGEQTIVSGNHAHPVAATLAAGRSGISGSGGTSLFVLDGWMLYEIGVEGAP